MKKTFIFTALILSLLVIAGCSDSSLTTTYPKSSDTSSPPSSAQSAPTFRGEKGELVVITDSGIELEAEALSDGQAHYFNAELPSGESVYFFVVKSPDGNLRAAANGCQVCGDALQGFRQEGDFMVCNTCGNKYPLDKIATEKGGCNPAPISPNLEVVDGKVTIATSELEEVLQYF